MLVLFPLVVSAEFNSKYEMLEFQIAKQSLYNVEATPSEDTKARARQIVNELIDFNGYGNNQLKIDAESMKFILDHTNLYINPEGKERLYFAVENYLKNTSSKNVQSWSRYIHWLVTSVLLAEVQEAKKTSDFTGAQTEASYKKAVDLAHELTKDAAKRAVKYLNHRKISKMIYRFKNGAFGLTKARQQLRDLTPVNDRTSVNNVLDTVSKVNMKFPNFDMKGPYYSPSTALNAAFRSFHPKNSDFIASATLNFDYSMIRNFEMPLCALLFR